MENTFELCNRYAHYAYDGVTAMRLWSSFWLNGSGGAHSADAEELGCRAAASYRSTG